MSEQDLEKDTLETASPEEVKDEAIEEVSADDTDEDAAKLKELNKKLFERAKKAETELKALKKAKEQQPLTSNTSQIPAEEIQEIRLIATKGLDEEDIKQVRVLAKGKGVTLLEAVSDPLFDLYLREKKEKERKEKAKLGASKGSGTGSAEKSPGSMSDAEFKEFWAKKMGLK